MKRIGAIISIFVITIALVFGIVPKKTANAEQLGIAFGGHILVEIPCTCSEDEDVDLLFPFYSTETGGGDDTSIGLLTVGDDYVPDYPYYTFDMGAWVLGYYDPIADECEIGYDPYCIPIPADGSPESEMGTSLPFLYD